MPCTSPAPTRCPLKGSATNGQCVCPPLISSDSGILMLCVKDSCDQARLSSDPSLGVRPADPGVGHSGASGWLQSLSPIQDSGHRGTSPEMLVSREAPRKLLEMHHVLLACPGDMAPVKTCSHGAAVRECGPSVSIGALVSTGRQGQGCSRDTVLSGGFRRQSEGAPRLQISVTASSGTNSPCGCCRS